MRQVYAAIFIILMTGSVVAAEKSSTEKPSTIFVRECKALTKTLPDLALPCTDFVKGKSDETIRAYLAMIQSAQQQLVAQGPELAQSIMKGCMANTVAEKPDLGGLLFCLRIRRNGTDLEKLSKGEGSWGEYAKLANDASKPVPSYPVEDTAQSEKQRAAVRQAVVYACVKEGDGYVRALCGAVAAHEAFASRPFGDNGELAKAFDTVLKVYAITEAPKQAIQAEVKEILQRAGFNDQVAQAVANPQKGVEEGAKHVAGEAQKAGEAVAKAIQCIFGCG